MIRNNMRNIWAIGALATTAGIVSADILYDTLPEIVPTGVGPGLPGNASDYRALLSFIGGSSVFGIPLDMQAADDFALDQASVIDRLTVDMNSSPITANLPQMVMVEFFSDVDARPGDAAHYALSVSSDRLTRESSLVGPGPAGNGFRLGVDLGGLGVELGAGNWWFSVVGIGDDHAYQALRRNDQTTGQAIHFRNGGLAHGNGYQLGTIGSYEWVPFGDLHPTFGLHGDLNARIEGRTVPSPSAAGVLGVIAFSSMSRRRR